MPDYRTGDIIELTYFHSLSEGKFNTLKGLVYGHEKKNNLRESINFHTVVESENVSMKMKLLSPMVAKVKIEKEGSGRLRKKQNHIPGLQLPAGKLLEPIQKGRGYKPRAQSVDIDQDKKKDKRGRRKAISLDD